MFIKFLVIYIYELSNYFVLALNLLIAFYVAGTLSIYFIRYS